MNLSDKTLSELSVMAKLLSESEENAKNKHKHYTELLNESTGNDMIISEELADLAADGLKYLNAMDLVNELLSRIKNFESYINGLKYHK